MGSALVFGGWCFFAAVIFSIFMIESKDKTKAEITLEYEAQGLKASLASKNDPIS